MRHLIIIIIVLAWNFMPAIAQEDPLRELKEGGLSGNVHIEVDSLLEVNYYKLLDRSRKDPGVPGFRIRIYSESGLGARDGMSRVKGRFLSLFPGVDVYPNYDDAPYFKLYVGDFRTRSEALKFYDQVKRKFSNPIIVPDRINLKKEEEQE